MMNDNESNSWTARGAQHVLLTPTQMAAADRATIDSGIPGASLMAAAGAAVALAIRARWSSRPTVVLCGTGNNGGDGWVVARLLQEAGWPVRVALLGDRSQLQGDAAWAARAWAGGVEPARPACLVGAKLVVDALLGAGLNRVVSGAVAEMISAVNAAAVPVCAVDVPSGLDGATGQPCGAAIQADLTVTFFRRKPGHLLLPGRLLCGELVCARIGIPVAVLGAVGSETWANHPDLWRAAFPWPGSASHKYCRGHALVVGGDRLLGAGRLACLAAARIGAGLVTLAVPQSAWALQIAALTSVMVEALPADESVAAAVADLRRNALLIGPGLVRKKTAKAQVLALLATRRPCVLDAGALTAFQDEPQVLVQALHAGCVLTPHEGEFARLFALEGDKLHRAAVASRDSGAVVVLKGADTVVAAPDGRCVINDNAPPCLATAGAGDVLAGMIVGLLAAGMSAFEAACAAVWLHGLAADRLGWGLIAEDLPSALPAALQTLAEWD
ncbi:MAG TPA: NAD(P)H-hydrate dehydratase [Castellaniella sp.]|uniref:NAD(P)H-hydrate dehydratase n=1 Tax=Castellaniella sp. TaxID=1955812 RepID=UPI002F20FF06